MKRIHLVLLIITFSFVTNVYIQNNHKKGSVIILNGPSSVGKSSIIRSFQNKNNKVWLGIGLDKFFVDLLPSKFYLEAKPEHHTVMQGVASVDAKGNKVFNLYIGKEGQKVIKGMHRAIREYVRAGNNVIVDYINYDPFWIKDLKKSLKGIKVIFVKINASLKTIEEREKNRATSPQGHARSHYHTVHQGINYDLTINTDHKTVDEASEEIIKYLQK